MKVLLDTNVLLAPFQYKIDVFDEIERVLITKPEYFVLDKTIDEIKEIIRKGKKLKNRLEAKLALKLLESKNVGIIETDSKKRVDELILEIAKKGKYIVATLDQNLKKRLIKEGIRVIYLRGNHLEISW